LPGFDFNQVFVNISIGSNGSFSFNIERSVLIHHPWYGLFEGGSETGILCFLLRFVHAAKLGKLGEFFDLGFDTVKRQFYILS
jgi:hypothetical protein